MITIDSITSRHYQEKDEKLALIFNSNIYNQMYFIFITSNYLEDKYSLSIIVFTELITLLIACILISIYVYIEENIYNIKNIVVENVETVRLIVQ